ncbi:MAG: hypothetical protein HN808_05395 [Thaumarchaeota archaeon]|jgi:hypothetical protein|uniref:Uncharacterized protein n=1 Tax=uncultured marine thaumarchaeote KM3_34_C02 TaxID=1456129 RepID=A0A075H551_9ARCH|nr:hypothetical protein [uncultured marine thaumarchaeote KM3_34_C02]MBT7360006.1 hypothetical protein [Nitrososphaerota archaeon]|tara:strand:- start:106 stop:627 length:522 start_codon:yes stop_codon:yes gene_type:complete
MNWPGMGDPTKRKKTLKFLGMTAIIAISVGVGSSLIQGQMNLDNPLKVCINDRDTKYEISVKLELYIDKQRAEIPANIGFEDGCQRSLYTLNDDGIIYAEWTEEYPFEIGHFLWSWEFPMRDMEQSKSKIIVNGKESPHFINELLVDGYTYRAEFTSKDYDTSKDADFMPPEI